MKNLLLKVGAVAGVAGALVSKAFAAAPAMDTSIQTGFLDVVTGLKDTIFANILAVLPIAGVVLVTIVGIGVLMRWFHRVARA
jgi:hypothetical protein